MMNKPSALNVLRGLDPQLGGTSVSVPALAKYTRESGRMNATLAVFRPVGDTGSAESTGLPPSALHEIPWNPRSPSSVIGAWKHLSELVKRHDLVQIHGLWECHSFMAAWFAQSERKPYIVSAHGMLDSWALRNKHFKKTVYAALIERTNLRKAACLRALTRIEAEDYKAFGLRVPIAVIPNGVTIPEHLSPDAFLEQWPALAGKRIVLFLSRIHHKKGLDVLCKAWRTVSRDCDDLHLVLAGPDFENTRQGIEKYIAEEGLSGSVTLTGMLQSEMKWSALSAASVFVLPSYSEGFSVAILEALAAAKPVVITRQCNFPELEGKPFAAVIEPDVAQLEEALRSFLRLPASVLREYGSAARDYVQGHYSWSAIGNAMADVYSWMLDGDAPSNVDVFDAGFLHARYS
jgi:glycosyltransferase involved in cell wall biosynthesis